MTRRGRSPGEGIRLLAALTGESADTMAGDPGALGRGLLVLAGQAIGLVRGYASDDPAIREAAKDRWAELAAMLPPERPRAPEAAAGGLSGADRERLRAGLSRLVATLEEIRDEAGIDAPREG